MKEAIEIQIERKLIGAIEGVSNLQVNGIFSPSLDGETKSEPTTGVEVRVRPRSQIYEPHKAYNVECEIRLFVDSCESKEGSLFVDEFNAIAGLLEDYATDDNCVGISTERFDVHGMQQNAGGEADYDSAMKQWSANWTFTLTGVINN